MSEVIVSPAAPPVAAIPRAAVARLAVASVAIALLTFALEGWPILLPPVFAFGFAVGVLRIARRISTRRRRAAWRVAGCVLMLVSASLFLLALSAGRRWLSAELVRERKLPHIARCLQLYCEYHPEMPATLADVILEGALTTKVVISPLDPAHPFPEVGSPIPISWTYRSSPGPWPGDAQLIVLHDPRPYTPLAWRLPPPRGYAVLFADGRVALLRPSEFEQALAADRAHRVARGWPADPPPPPNRYLEPYRGWQPPPGWVPPADWPFRTPGATTAPASATAPSAP